MMTDEKKLLIMANRAMTNAENFDDFCTVFVT